ncbi:STAS domain-containing protein [Streptomyces sp. NPDC058659]|uniref:STAS domain-containing protein n=1 Tax=unclassified Streptomyces TaxID=2593676 RepID=UPI003655139B
MEAGSSRFLVETRPGGRPDTVVLLLSGELDHETVGPLRNALKEHHAVARLVVDCSGLRFCDSTGLNVLLRARLRMAAGGGRVELSGLRPPVDRMFEITGALKLFQVYEDPGAALADRRGEDPPSDGAEGSGAPADKDSATRGSA